MHVLILLSLLCPVALAATHTVEVGDDGKIAFVPDTLQAAVGDTVVFEFYPGGHSVAQSTFASPCQPSTGGIWSGTFSPTGDKASNVFEITIANTDPIWLYCGQVGHCNAGMAMVINPPSGGNTLASYKSAAADAKLVVPSTVEGGVVKPASESSSESGSASASSTAAASSAASTSAAAETTASTSAASTSKSSPAPATTSAPSPPESSAGTATAASTTAQFTGGASNTNEIGPLVAVAVIGAGALGWAMM